MALPTSGALSISQIGTELSSSSGSLRTLSSLAGFSTPDAISEFYGYSPVVNYTVYWQFYPQVDFYNYFQIFNYTKGTEAASLEYYGSGYASGSFEASPGDLIGVSIYAATFDSFVGINCNVYEYPAYNTLLSYSTSDYSSSSGFGQFYMPSNPVEISMSTAQYYWWM